VSKKVKRSKSPLREVAGGGVKRSARATSLKNGQDSEKFLSKKGGIPDEVRRVLDGPAPEIAHPEDPAFYVEQWRFVNFWFKEMFKRVGSGNSKSAREARVALMELLLLGVTELTPYALDYNNSSRQQWAQRLLAIIDVWIEKHREKFGKAYEEYRRKLSVEFRNDVWEPKSPLYKALHRELWLCQFYRGEIPWPKAQQYLPKVSAKPPKEYLPLMKLPKLLADTWQKWDDPLWDLVKNHNPDLLEKLRMRSVKGRTGTDWGHYRKEFRQHLETIAKAQG
jgi:hypothetical protein